MKFWLTDVNTVQERRVSKRMKTFSQKGSNINKVHLLYLMKKAEEGEKRREGTRELCKYWGDGL